MGEYVLRRVVALVPVLMVVAVVSFSILHLTPGDPAGVILGFNATQEDIDRVHRQLGLDQPLLVQFVRWVGGVLRGDLGESLFMGQPVTQAIREHLEPTIMLTLYALVIAVGVALPLGILAPTRRTRLADQGLIIFSLLGVSIPDFLLGLLLILFFSVRLHWLPSAGYQPLSAGLWPNLRSLLLPAIALGAMQSALLTRITRSSVLEVLNQEYVNTARAKGLSAAAVLVRHVLKNALIPIITTIGLVYAVLMAGAVIVETVFNLPGVGKLVVNSVLRSDYPVIQGAILLVAVMYVLINLAVDVIYAFVDPRIRY